MQKGTLDRWNDDKGFGFIRPENSQEDIFFHISSLQALQRRPKQGDLVYFNVKTDEKGRKQAVEVGIEGVKSVFQERVINNPHGQVRKKTTVKASASRATRYQAHKTSGRFASGVSTLFVVVLILFVVNKFNVFQGSEMPEVTDTVMATNFESEYPTASISFKCEGKTRCNQMTSCDEAVFYLNNCPGSVTDGDGDGRPCEDQWCGH